MTVVLLDPTPMSGSHRVPMPTPAEYEAIAAAIELASAIMQAETAALIDRLPELATAATHRENLAALGDAAEWLAAWSDMIGHARKRLAQTLTTGKTSK